MTVVASGHGQIDHWLGVGFLVANPNADLAIERAQYQVAVYDSSGAVVGTESGTIELVMPSQTLGVATRVSLREGIEADRTEVQLSQGKAAMAEPIPDFGISNVSYRREGMGSQASGILSSPLDIDLDSLQVAAIAYNQAGEIVGGGKTFGDFIRARGQTSVEVPLVCTSDVAKVELYPSIKALVALTRQDLMPADAAPPVLVQSGFGQDDDKIGYGLLVNNPNEGYAIENTRFHITVLDTEGSVMIVHPGFIPVLLPGETQGVGGVFYMQEVRTADQLDVQLLPGRYTPSEAIASLTAENISYQADQFAARTTGMIVNPHDKEVSQIGVSAIAYDDAGEIVGGGVARIDFVPANGKAAVEVTTVSSAEPASVELYASATTLSALE
jgi:hypothetical protein